MQINGRAGSFRILFSLFSSNEVCLMDSQRHGKLEKTENQIMTSALWCDDK